MSDSHLDLNAERTGQHLIDCGLLDRQDLDLLGRELSEAAPELNGHCPLDAARLRSNEAVRAYGIWLYVLVRSLQPKVVVETGVQNGSSTELILWALHRNRLGRLHSVDSGPTSTDGSHHTQWNVTKDGVPGKDVLQGLRDWWELTIGTSQEKLPDLCRRLGSVDIFWHDSDHSSENVRFEFETVKPYVSTGGVVCLHDFQGQDVKLEDAFNLVAPQEAPYLRIWRRK